MAAVAAVGARVIARAAMTPAARMRLDMLSLRGLLEVHGQLVDAGVHLDEDAGRFGWVCARSEPAGVDGRHRGDADQLHSPGRQAPASANLDGVSVPAHREGG